MTRHETFAAIAGEIAAARDALRDQGTDVVEIGANERYRGALTRGLDVARGEDGAAFTAREVSAIGETIAAFGLAVSVSGDRAYQRCELSGFQCWCHTYSFHVREAE